MMKLYRIEDTNAAGPYMRDSHIVLPFTNSLHPEPFDDGIEEFDETYICAFESLESAANWFCKKSIEILSETKDFFLSVYEAPEEMVLIGGHQVGVVSEAMKLVEQYDVSKLDEFRRK